MNGLFMYYFFYQQRGMSSERLLDIYIVFCSLFGNLSAKLETVQKGDKKNDIENENNLYDWLAFKPIITSI